MHFTNYHPVKSAALAGTPAANALNRCQPVYRQPVPGVTASTAGSRANRKRRGLAADNLLV